MEELNQLIEEESKELICETHPKVCALRDANYAKLETLVLQMIFAEDEPVSVQTALAQVEQELGNA